MRHVILCYVILFFSLTLPQFALSQTRVEVDSLLEEMEYLFPKNPLSTWSLGVKGGVAFVAGDVKAQPGFGFAVDARKALGHVFSLRLQAAMGQTKGLNYQAFSGYANHGKNPWNERYFRGGINQIDNTRIPPEVFYNFKMNYGDLALQAVVNMNNINFYKERVKWNIYGAAGFGVMAYHTRIDAGFGTNTQPYDFANVPELSGDNSLMRIGGRKDVLNNLKSILDGIYESPGEGHVDETAIQISGNNYVVNPILTFAGGLRYRLGSRIELELEHRIVWSNDDLLDGQRWQEYATGLSSLTRDFDSYNQTTLGIHFRLGKGEEALWWANPLTEIYSSAQEAREIVKRLTDDSDNDGVPDLYDKEPDTPIDSPVDGEGRTFDSDQDGYPDNEDDEPFTPKGCDVDGNGVALDVDNDGVPDCTDHEPNSPPGMSYDAKGVALQMPNASSSGSGDLRCEQWLFTYERGEVEAATHKYFGHMYKVLKHPNNQERQITMIPYGNASDVAISKKRVTYMIDIFVRAGIARNRFFVEEQIEGAGRDQIEMECYVE